jgi:hypothetical protein
MDGLNTVNPLAEPTLAQDYTEASQFLAGLTSAVKAAAAGYPLFTPSGDGWLYAGPVPPSLQALSGWKLHVYAQDPHDWMDVARVMLPLLKQSTVFFKTLSGFDVFDRFNQTQQEGKLFTLYFHTVADLKQVLYALDVALALSDCIKPEGVHIAGDRAIGTCGRLFYRYDRDEQGQYRYNDGQYKPESVPDPLLAYDLETQLVGLPQGYMLYLGREYSGGRLWDASVSRRHVRVERQAEGLVVSDEGSKNGTWVNGHRINEAEAVLLQPGDTLRLGRSTTVPTIMVYPTLADVADV